MGLGMKIYFQKVMQAVAVLFLLYGANGFPQEEQHLFTEGNTYYQNGQYSDALGRYSKILHMGYESGPLYYNMGNCYYKLQNIGRAILYYEKAKRLMPNDEDLKENLVLANLAVVDKIPPKSEFILFQWIHGFYHLLPKVLLAGVVAGLYVGFIGFLICWILSSKRVLRIAAFRMGVVFGIFFLVFGLSLFGRLRGDKKKVEGIILEAKVDVMSAPNEEEGVEVFSLHEGTKVRLGPKSGEWVKITLLDGKVGWVKQKTLETI